MKMKPTKRKHKDSEKQRPVYCCMYKVFRKGCPGNNETSSSSCNETSYDIKETTGISKGKTRERGTNRLCVQNSLRQLRQVLYMTGRKFGTMTERAQDGSEGHN